MNYFTVQEFQKSETATKLGIDNVIPIRLLPNMYDLVTMVLQPCREFIKIPIRINSGYRCPLLNKAVGGVPGSQHLLCQAADITTGYRARDLQIVDYIAQHLAYDQMIVYKNFIHISYNCDRNRMEIIYKAK